MSAPPELLRMPDAPADSLDGCDRCVLATVQRLFVDQNWSDAAIGFLASKDCYIVRVETVAAGGLEGALGSAFQPQVLEVLGNFPSPRHWYVLFRVHRA